VDRHKEVLHLYVKGQEHVVIAARLAKRRVEPTELSFSTSDGNEAYEAVSALLTGEQHHCLFGRVRRLSLRCALSKEILQVRAAHLFKHAATST
jgi:hypothetical protein